MSIEQLNPEVKEVIIGVRKMEELKLYPLSIGELFKLTKLIKQTLQSVSSISSDGTDLEDSGNDLEVITVVVEGIKNNLSSVLTLVTDEKGEDLLLKITPNQALDISNVIFDMNFAETPEKLKGLVEKVKKAFGIVMTDLPDPEDQ